MGPWRASPRAWLSGPIHARTHANNGARPRCVTARLTTVAVATHQRCAALPRSLEYSYGYIIERPRWPSSKVAAQPSSPGTGADSQTWQAAVRHRPSELLAPHNSLSLSSCTQSKPQY